MRSRPFILTSLLLSVALALGTSTLPGCDRIGNLSSAQSVQHAKDKQSKGDLKGSHLELKNATQKDSNNVQASRLLANVLIQLGDGASAEKEIKKAMDLGLGRSAGQVTLVHALLLQGDLERVFQESSELKPDVPNADRAAILGLRGQAYIAKGQFGPAQQALEQALQIKPDSLPELIGMTALHGYQRQYDVARQWVEKAAAAHPQALQPRVALARYPLAKGDKNQALSLAREAVNANPANPAIMGTLGWALVQQRQTERGIQLLKQALAKAPDAAEIQFRLASALAQSGDRARALGEVEPVVSG